MSYSAHEDGALTDRATALLADGVETPKSAAAFLKISQAKLYKYMGDGDIPFIKIGRSRRIPRRGLVQFLACGLVTKQE